MSGNSYMDTESNLRELEEAEHLAALLLKQLRQEITAEELQQLNNCISKDPSYKQVYDQINNEEKLLADLLSVQQVDKKAWWQKITEQTVAPVISNPVPFFRRLRTWVTAAVVLIVAGVVYRNVVFNKPPAGTNENDTPGIGNILPGGNKATLTLSNGSVVNLGNTANGTVAEDGNATVVKLKDGELKYESNGPTKGREHGSNKQFPTGNFNMLSTPRGGQYHLTLPDGSKVWVNAASSIKFPTRFAHHERRVAITGEAFFDVNPKKVPFIVSIQSASGETVAEVEVLGTQFNINAYSDEEAIKTTLVNGKVKISVRHNTGSDPRPVEHSNPNVRFLAPGQQAQIPITVTGARLPDSIKVVEQADTETAIAWKNGFHSFKNADIKTIMRMLGRWYNIDIAYEGNIPSHKYTGSIPRSEKMSAVLHMLEYAGIHYRLQENRVIVIP
jgi:transmembrane sensor